MATARIIRTGFDVYVGQSGPPICRMESWARWPRGVAGDHECLGGSGRSAMLSHAATSNVPRRNSSAHALARWLSVHATPTWRLPPTPPSLVCSSRWPRPRQRQSNHIQRPGRGDRSWVRSMPPLTCPHGWHT